VDCISTSPSLCLHWSPERRDCIIQVTWLAKNLAVSTPRLGRTDAAQVTNSRISSFGSAQRSKADGDTGKKMG
jgi:hypothetical protein